jgi:hypothetical protein
MTQSAGVRSVPRYAIIDRLTNFIWGVVDAETAVDACRAVDAEFQEFGYEYAVVPAARRSQARSAYAVFKVPAGFSVRDGTDPAEIRAVKSSTFEALVERRN